VETFLHVREDALQLYGFADDAERRLFLQLLTSAGSGRRSRSPSSPARPLRSCAARSRSATMPASRPIPGIGKKTAERIVLELRDKVVLPAQEADATFPGEGPGHLVARDALVELGYTVAEAEQRLASVDPELPPAERVRQALRAA
jgi:Holliday junction DNA helicase RuvA